MRTRLVHYFFVLLLAACALGRAKLSAQDLRDARVFVQYGEPRTATTLQSEILMRVVEVLHQQRAVFNYTRNVVTCATIRDVAKDGRYHVLKTHSPPNSMTKCPSAVMFATAHQHADLRWVRGAHYVQVYERLVERGWAAELAQYAQFFQLSQREHVTLHQYVRWWSIVRQCCGFQSSVDTRNSLRAGKEDDKTLRYPFLSFGYVGCRTYNLTEVERLLRTSDLGRRYGTVPDGHCESSISAIRAGKGFNGVELGVGVVEKHR